MVMACLMVSSGIRADEIRHAQYLSIRETPDSIILEVTKATPGRSSRFLYRIVRDENKILLADGTRLPFPLRRIGISNVFQVALLRELGLLDRTVCMSYMNYLKSEDLRRDLKRINVREVSGPTGINIEQVMAAAPDGFFINLSGSVYDPDESLRRYGIPYIVSAEWLEESLLGRSEWIKFFAAFFDQLPQARRWFDQLSAQYQKELKLHSSSDTARVLWGSVFNGQVWLAGNRSYVAHFIRETGLDFLGQRYSTQTQQVSLEIFMELFKQADILIYSGEITTLDELLQLEPRLRQTPGFERKTIYSLRSSYHEFGIISPHLIIQDLNRMKSGKFSRAAFFKLLH